MTGPEIKKALWDLFKARSDEKMRLIQHYDETVYRPAVGALVEQCPHDEVTPWLRNGIGWSWKQCRWCGKRMESAPTDEVGGIHSADYREGR